MSIRDALRVHAIERRQVEDGAVIEELKERVRTLELKMDAMAEVLAAMQEPAERAERERAERGGRH